MNAPANPAPWDRFGWVMAVVWLFFLAFPLLEVLERSGWERVGGVAAIGTFVAIYVFGFVRFPRIGPSQRVQNLTLIALVVVAAFGSLILGLVALTFVPFITAFGTYFQPPRRSIALSALWIIFTVAVLSISGAWQLYGVIGIIVPLVAVVTFVPRWLDNQQQAYLALRSQYARIAEQERVARDVHDVLGHSLTVITVKAELAGRLLDRAGTDEGCVDHKILDGAAHEIASIESLSRQALSEIRATVAGLRVARLDEELVNAHEAARSAGVQLDVTGEPEDLDPRHRLVAGWVLREAITNVVRHAGAATCRIEIGPRGLAVVDDGCGIDSGREGSGISGLRERVRLSGGELTVKGTTQAGTRLEVQW